MDDCLVYVIMGDDCGDDGPWVCDTAYTIDTIAEAEMERFIQAHPANTYKMFEVRVTCDVLRPGNC